MCRNSGFLITGMMVSATGIVALCCRNGGSQTPDRWLNGSRNTHLDDLGIERNTEYSLENLFNVIDARYVSGKAMIITTNLNLEELKNQKQLSLKRIYDRVLERCIPVCVSENDFRKDNRVEAKVKFGKIINGGKMDEEKYE